MAKIKFRSIVDLLDYNDDEVNNLPSLTDPSQDEPIEKLVNRLLRGEQVSTTPIHFDSDGLPPGVPPTLNQVNQSGFDLSDVPPLLDEAAKALEADSKASKPLPEVTPTPEPKKPIADEPEASKHI